MQRAQDPDARPDDGKKAPNLKFGAVGYFLPADCF